MPLSNHTDFLPDPLLPASACAPLGGRKCPFLVLKSPQKADDVLMIKRGAIHKLNVGHEIPELAIGLNRFEIF